MCYVKILDTNLIQEPIKMCIAKKVYKIDSAKISNYTLVDMHGEKQLLIDDKLIPLIEVRK